MLISFCFAGFRPTVGTAVCSVEASDMKEMLEIVGTDYELKMASKNGLVD